MPTKKKVLVADVMGSPAGDGPSWHDRLESLFGPGPMLSLQQMAEITGFSDRFISDACDTGDLICYRFGNGPGDKMRTRVARLDAMLFLASHAEFEPDVFVSMLRRLVVKQSTRELEILKEAVVTELARRAPAMK